MIGSIGVLLGYSSNSIICNMQAILTDIGYLYSAAWTVANTYQLWKVVDKCTIISNKEMIRFHIVIWSVPLLLAFLPFIWDRYPYGHEDDDHYGTAADDDIDPWCFISTRNSKMEYQLLYWFTYWGWLTALIIAMFYYLFKIFQRIRSIDNLPYIIKASFMKLFLYPCVFYSITTTTNTTTTTTTTTTIITTTNAIQLQVCSLYAGDHQYINMVY